MSIPVSERNGHYREIELVVNPSLKETFILPLRETLSGDDLDARSYLRLSPVH